MIGFIVACIGLAVGSFANVLIDRVPAAKSMRGRSHCDRCRRALRWWELVPALSAIALRFRCPTCAARIRVRYTAVELATAALYLSIFLSYGGVTAHGCITAFALTALGVLALIDAEYCVVPDSVSVPAIIIVAAAQLVLTRSWIVLVSIAIGAGFFLVQRLCSRGRWVGDGDVRVGALMGALFSPAMLAVALGSGYVVGGVLAGVLLVTRRVERGAHIPLVPFLFIGSLIAVFFGEIVLSWYGLS